MHFFNSFYLFIIIIFLILHCVVAKSSISTLSSLTVQNVQLSPTFDEGILEYSGSVDNNVAVVSIDFDATDANAAVKVKGISTTTSPLNVDLALGLNNISIEVQSPDESSITIYYILITRGKFSIYKIL